MKFYEEKRLAMKQLDKLLLASQQKKTNMNVDLLLYELMLNYMVSKKAILEALELAKSKYNFDIKNNEVQWK